MASTCLHECLRARLVRSFAVVLLLGGVAACAPMGEWIPRRDEPPGPRSSRETVHEAREVKERLERGVGKYVVVDVDVNELRFMDGDRVLWSAPVGTGTGFRLSGDENDWEFSTPAGLFHVQYKEEVPVWILPDWYFIENDLPIPPETSPERRIPGGLGAAGIFLGDQIAIHGTDKPWLLGQRVSHGCIRLSNYHAQRLFHNVQVGTPVVIVGGEDLEPLPIDSIPQVAEDDERREELRDTLGHYTTEQLLARLDEQLQVTADSLPRWIPTVSRLITRGITDDSLALRGVLTRAGSSEHDAVNREYATFLADAFGRGSLRAVVSLARIDADARERAARAIVYATMDLYHGSLDDFNAPWPTRRVPAWRLGPEGMQGWEALRAAEDLYRSEGAESRIVLQAGS